MIDYTYRRATLGSYLHHIDNIFEMLRQILILNRRLLRFNIYFNWDELLNITQNHLGIEAMVKIHFM